MKTQFRVTLLVLTVFLGLQSESFAKGKMGSFGIGALGGIHSLKDTNRINHLFAGGRLLALPTERLGIFADFSYWLKKSNISNMQAKLGANFFIPTGGVFVPYIGAHASYNMLKSHTITVLSIVIPGVKKKVFGFGGQLGAHILMGSRFSFFFEGTVDYMLKATGITSKARIGFGGLGGLMVHF